MDALKIVKQNKDGIAVLDKIRIQQCLTAAPIKNNKI